MRFYRSLTKAIEREGVKQTAIRWWYNSGQIKHGFVVGTDHWGNRYYESDDDPGTVYNNVSGIIQIDVVDTLL